MINKLKTNQQGFRKYESFKDSGIEHIGIIPEHWSLSPLKYLVAAEPNAFVDGPFGSDLKNEDYVESGVPLIQLNNITSLGHHLLQNMKFISEEKAQELRRHVIYPGEIVIAKMAEPVARAASVINEYDKYVIVADCVKFSPNDQKALVPFLIYAINSPYFRIQAEQQATGTTRIRVNLSTLKNLCVLMPMLEEQYDIVNYLDYQIARIDATIADKERMITLLQEQRQSIISEAVTKGLDPNVPMKDSGIEFLGQVPGNWEILKIKYVSTIGYGLGQPPKLSDEGIPILRATNIQRGKITWAKMIFAKIEDLPLERAPLLDKGEILVVRSGAYTGDSAIVTDEFAGSAPGYDLRVKALGIDPNYLSYYLLSSPLMHQINIAKLRAAQPHLNAEDLGNCIVTVPPHEEQLQIVSHINYQISSVDRTISDIQSQIEKLREFRQSLITEAVTGKIDVRGSRREAVV